MNSNLIPAETIEKKILILRNQKVMLDLHVAELYEIDKKALKRAVKPNQARFPNDFCFQLTLEKFRNLRYHFGTSNWGGIRYALYAFTEQGVTIIAPTVRLRSLTELRRSPHGEAFRSGRVPPKNYIGFSPFLRIGQVE